MRILFFLALLMVGSSPVAYSKSRVQQHFLESDRSPRAEWVVSPMIGFLPFKAVELGAKASHEILDNGFIEALNDSISAEVSLFYGEWKSDPSLYVSGNMRWDFHLVPEWTVFGAPGLSIRQIDEDDGDIDSQMSVSFHLGGFWNIQEDLALRADVDLESFNPRAGIAFRF